MVSENPDNEDDLSEIRALNFVKTSASGETVGYMSKTQLPLNQKGIHLTYPINPTPTPTILCFQFGKIWITDIHFLRIYSFIYLMTTFLSLLLCFKTVKRRKPWSGTERKVIEHYFKNSIKEMKAPGKVDCEKCLNENKILKDNGRDWKAVKYFVHNRITSIKRNVGEQYPWELVMHFK